MKRRVAVGWMALAAGAAVAPALALKLAPPAAAQDEASEVGAGPPADASLRLVGRGEFGPDSARLYGFLSGIIGLGGDGLYAGGNHSEATAAFTWTAALPSIARDARGDVTTFAGDGELVVRHEPAGGASWDDPASFARGETLATYALSLATAVQRQSPALGVVVGDGTLTQERGEAFTLAGEPFRFGHPGAGFRLRFTGALAGEGAPAGQPWPVAFTGTAIAPIPVGRLPASRAATPGAVAAAGAPEASNDAATCAGWAGSTRDRLRAAGSRAAAARAQLAAERDPAGLDAAAAATDADLAAQRAEPFGDADAPTNRLAAAALGTYARGLRALADAAAAGDDAAAAAALQTLSDGDGLAERALADILARYLECV